MQYIHEVNVFFATGWCKTMLAYGADLDAQNVQSDGYTPLHLLAAYAPPIAVARDVVRLLVAAGNDIDAHCLSYHEDRGPTPLCWCLTAHPAQLGGPTDAHYELASFLIEEGCDVLLSHHEYLRMGAVLERDGGMMWPSPSRAAAPCRGATGKMPLALESGSDAEVHGRFLAFFREKLEAAGLDSDSESDSAPRRPVHVLTISKPRHEYLSVGRDAGRSNFLLTMTHLVEGDHAVLVFIGLLHDRVGLARDLGVALRPHVVRPQRCASARPS